MNDALLLPKIRHARWMGWTEVAGRDLFEKHGLPRVGIGEETAERFAFVTPAELARSGRSWTELEAIAVANLRKRPVQWTVTEQRLGEKPVLLKLIDEHAGERLLDSDFLHMAHRLLHHEILAVTAPVRGILFAAPGIAGPDDLAAFLTLAERAFVEVPANLEPISPAVFTVQKGRLSGVIHGHPRRSDEVTPARGFPWPTRDLTQPRL